MDTHFDLLGQLRLEWATLGHSREASSTFFDFRQRHPELPLRDARDLGDLVAALEPRGGLRVLERAHVVQALLEDATQPMVHRTLLQTLLPGIVCVCREFRFGDGIVERPSDALNEALALASELLSDWSGESRAYAAPDILSALRGRLRRWLLKEKAQQAQLCAHEMPDVAAREATDLLTRLSLHENGPHARIARITYERVFEGRALKELAARDHSAPAALQQELRQFATKFLL